jgi:protein-S-isoprenylcysteine O-methyltransferase Ste14
MNDASNVTAKHKKGEHPWGDAGQVVLLALFLIVWVGDSFFLRRTTFLSDGLSLHVRLIVAVPMFFVAVYLLRSSRVVVRPERRLAGVVSSGAFRYVRHPMYLGSLLAGLGLTVSTACLAALAPLLGLFLFCNHIARFEEAVMAEKFGDEYRQYKQRTGKWIPRLRRHSDQ